MFEFILYVHELDTALAVISWYEKVGFRIQEFWNFESKLRSKPSQECEGS
jgi:hypothetical protein